MKVKSFSVSELPSVILIFFLFTIAGCSLAGQSARHYSSPEEAIAELRLIVYERNKQKAQELFGSEADFFLYSGDENLDRQRAERFVKMFSEQHQLRKEENGEYTLLVGKRNWPFPVPLVKRDSGWIFDSAQGKEVILDRIIGFNELSAIATAQRIYLAQKAYSELDLNSDGLADYAARIVSSPGTKDGLYWPGADSPLGDLIAGAAYESYTNQESGEPQPYKGYYYRLITANPDVRDQYWLIVYPAVWGNSGIMSFAMNERGWIFQKNIGRDFELSPDFSIEDLRLVNKEGWQRIQ